MSITSASRYHEDYAVGQVFKHRRGHTVSATDNQYMSLLTMNTAQTHFNSDFMSSYMEGAFPAPLLNACIALSLSVGLTSEDMSENAITDVGYCEFVMPAPVFVGDTLYVESEVLAIDEPSPRQDAGVLAYRLTTTKASTEEVVVTAIRRVLIKRRSAWYEADATFSAERHSSALHLLRGVSGTASATS